MDTAANRDEGFTLIELMVVLLIIAILLAIAIPTFLGARNTANARSTQEDLRNALSAELTYWSSNQTFGVGLSTIEPSLTWSTATVSTKGGNLVSVGLYTESISGSTLTATGPAYSATAGTTYDGTAIIGYGKDGNCYAIYQSENSLMDFTAYQEYAATSSTCALPAAPTGLPSTGSAGSHSAGGTWYTSF